MISGRSCDEIGQRSSLMLSTRSPHKGQLSKVWCLPTISGSRASPRWPPETPGALSLRRLTDASRSSERARRPSERPHVCPERPPCRWQPVLRLWRRSVAAESGAECQLRRRPSSFRVCVSGELQVYLGRPAVAYGGSFLTRVLILNTKRVCIGGVWGALITMEGFAKRHSQPTVDGLCVSRVSSSR